MFVWCFFIFILMMLGQFNFRNLRLWWRRMTISAPKLKVSADHGWLRTTIGVLVSILVVGGVIWGFNVGGQFAGFNRSEAEEERKRLTTQLEEVNNENIRLRTLQTRFESQIMIERTARAQLEEQMRQLTAMSAQLKEDLALVENVVAIDQEENKLQVHGLKTEIQEGVLKYRMLLVHGTRVGSFLRGSTLPDFNGSIDFELRGSNDEVKPMRFPEQGKPSIGLKFRYMRHIEGSIPLSAGIIPKTVAVRILDARGNIRATATSASIVVPSVNQTGRLTKPSSP